MPLATSSLLGGQDYTRYVRGLAVTGTRAHASVQANASTRFTSGVQGDVDGDCTCPHFASGWFCKHLVAVGLVVIDEHQDGGHSPTAIRSGAGSSDPVPAYLDSLDAPALRRLVLTLAEHEMAADHLALIAAMGTGRTEDAEQALKAAAQEALRTREYVDYRNSFEAAARAQLMLNELEAHLDAGRADLAAQALLYSTRRLRSVVLNAYDSAGVLGGACQQVASLYARSCREGSPDQLKLGRWLVKFRADSPGLPDVTLEDFTGALGTKGLAVYRKGVLALDAKTPPTGNAYERFEIERMLLELADHDGDIDRAIELLAGGEHARIAAIVDRLRNAGRGVAVLAWIDRAVAEGRVSGRVGGRGAPAGSPRSGR